jgi:hypothetical protein
MHCLSTGIGNSSIAMINSRQKLISGLPRDPGNALLIRKTVDLLPRYDDMSAIEHNHSLARTCDISLLRHTCVTAGTYRSLPSP